VAVVKLLTIALGLLALVSMPCWMVLVFSAADEMIVRAARAARRRLRGPQPTDPPIEQVAADLRRLANLRLGVAQRSMVWSSAVAQAYDDRLRVACRELALEEYLGELTGVDLDIERVRVEGVLQVAGIKLSPSDAARRQDPP
jgi:hypothetical protein